MCQNVATSYRPLVKTASFAVLHFGVAFLVAYLLTGSVAAATGIGLIEPLANTVAFYFHERVWARAEARASRRRADRRPVNTHPQPPLGDAALGAQA
ncbi:MAG: DUF2061 domain-containing protein [Steroidobacteraceae bacterium]|nr:DUF2061 domain-containing protein [Nevskiaceae bacterium]MCP5338695.1 DUF2061 domain-containing protein [Nevskiaceae bacterium]MCP5472994.1 DUF2061 domain-containing protein [Nevskiaceae bacterium]